MLASVTALGNWPRVVSADEPIDNGGAGSPVDNGIGFADSTRVGRPFRRLLFRLQFFSKNRVQTVSQQHRTRLRQPIMELARRFRRCYRDAFGAKDRTCIQPRIHLHEADARLRIARQYCRLDR